MLLLAIGIGLLAALGVAATRPPHPPERLPSLPPVAAGRAGRQYFDVGEYAVVLPLNAWARIEYVSKDGQRIGCRFECGCAAVYDADDLAK